MRVAYCLYGQPRDYKAGFSNLKACINANPSATFDVYFHTWRIPSDEIYETSPWSIDANKRLKQDVNIENILVDLYCPVKYIIEDKIVFDTREFEYTIAYKNTTNPVKRNNMHNVLSQLHSRMQVCKLFTGENKPYDYIVTTRFDRGLVDFDLSKLDTTKVYVPDVLVPRCILPDICMLFPVETYKVVFSDMFDVFNDKSIEDLMRKHHEIFEINAENVIFANYLKVHKNMDSVIFTNLIK